MVKVKLNSIVCIQTTHSFTEVNSLRTKIYKTFVLAKAVKVNRKGLVVEYQTQNDSTPLKVNGKNQIVMVIGDPDKQAAAKDLFLNSKNTTFKNGDAARQAILDHMQMTA